jgi:PAS domain S-box-containing protein
VDALVDIADSQEEAEPWLLGILESSGDAIVSKDLDGIILTWNPGAERLFGYTASEVIGMPITILIPVERREEEPAILERIRRGERVDPYDTVRQRKDGTFVEISLTVSPIKHPGGEVIGASKIARDLTELRQAQEQQRLLFREMNHRIKNLFTLAISIVMLSKRFAATPGELADAVSERLHALARAHDLTLPVLNDEQDKFARPATLQALVQTILAPYLAPGYCPATIGGPDVPIGGRPALGVALLLHEMATNSAKYGALTSDSGHVDVSWSVSGGVLELTWRESGGPPIDRMPEHKGFGTLLSRLTGSQLGGEISTDWSHEGLTVRLSAPFDRLKG